MAFKTITTVVTDMDLHRSVLDAAADVAAHEKGHLEVFCLGIDYTQPGFYYAGAGAMAMQSTLAEAEERALSLETAVKEHLSKRDISWGANALAAQSAGLGPFLSQYMRFSDLVVLGQPYGSGRGQESEAIVESSLFDAGAPVMVMPDGVGFPKKINRIVVAWNESREALAAIHRAMPLLIAADIVNIAIIDPPTHSSTRSDPGGALSQMLARHDVHVEISVLAKTMPRVSDVIARHVQDENADILVMGAYGHSRFRESILGGATRNMLQMSKVPIFMAH
ncbi:MAG: universal stress protein [Paracoccaceae bacterium]